MNKSTFYILLSLFLCLPGILWAADDNTTDTGTDANGFGHVVDANYDHDGQTLGISLTYMWR